MNRTPKIPIRNRKWFFPVLYIVFTLISFVPPITQKIYSPENTQDVILELLKTAINPYRPLGFIFHIATIILVIFAAKKPKKSGKFVSIYFGLNFLIIAFAQSFGNTMKYGFVVHSGGLIAFSLLGMMWIWAGIKGRTKVSFQKITWNHLLLLPLAILAFWSPFKVEGNSVIPDFNPVLLFTSADYGLTFCFTTPVFLYLVILFFNEVDLFVYRTTAFNGFLYALFNFSHWVNPDFRWMGFLHLPLLIISLTALIHSNIFIRRESY